MISSGFCWFSLVSSRIPCFAQYCVHIDLFLRLIVWLMDDSCSLIYMCRNIDERCVHE